MKTKTKFAALLAVLSIGLSTPALAHPKLVSSTPAASATVSATNRLTLTFSERLMPRLSGVDLAMTGMPGMANHAPMKIGGATTAVGEDGKTLIVVRRQNIWHNSRRKLAECGPRPGVDIKRRSCGGASGDVRWSSV